VPPLDAADALSGPLFLRVRGNALPGLAISRDGTFHNPVFFRKPDAMNARPTVFFFAPGIFCLTLLVCQAQQAPKNGTHEGLPALVIANGKLELTATLQGSTLANLILADDPEKLSPLSWMRRMSATSKAGWKTCSALIAL
jgi:hypothetical protein